MSLRQLQSGQGGEGLGRFIMPPDVGQELLQIARRHLTDLWPARWLDRAEGLHRQRHPLVQRIDACPGGLRGKTD